MMKFLGLSLFALCVLVGPSNAEGFYVGTYGGANWDDVINTPGVSDNTGYVVGGVVGTNIKSVPGLRVEADLSFRQNDVDIDWYVPLKASHETFAVMANAVYELPFSVNVIKPYVMAGIGYGHSEAILEDISLVKVESSGVAYQLGAGITAPLTDDITFGLGYRYLKTEPLEVFGQELSDGSNHSVVASLNFSLN